MNDESAIRKFLPVQIDEIAMPRGGRPLRGLLAACAAPAGLIVLPYGGQTYAHGRHDERVMQWLIRRRFAVLRINLCSPEEEIQEPSTLALQSLVDRTVDAILWTQEQPGLEGLPLGCFGSDIGGAFVLAAAAEVGPIVRAIVLSGARTDLAGAAAARLEAPTLLVVDESDGLILDLNRRTYDALWCERDLVAVATRSSYFEDLAGATHVGRLAAEWFAVRLAKEALPAAAEHR